MQDNQDKILDRLLAMPRSMMTIVALKVMPKKWNSENYNKITKAKLHEDIGSLFTAVLLVRSCLLANIKDGEPSPQEVLKVLDILLQEIGVEKDYLEATKDD